MMWLLIFEHVNERFMDGASYIETVFEASNCTSSLARAHSTPIKDLGALETTSRFLFICEIWFPGNQMS